MAKIKLTYDDIKLMGKVRHPNASEKSPNYIGEIFGIDNMASLAGINEPVFIVQFRDFKAYFGLKYILRNYIND